MGEISTTTAAASSIPWSAIIPVVGTILGALIGGLIGLVTSLKLTDKQLRHTDRTRFHNGRLESYTEFLAAASSMRVSAQVIQRGDDLSPAAKETLLTSMQAVGKGFAQIKLVASGPVLKAAKDYYFALHKFREEGPGEGEANDRAMTLTSVAFQREARRELGIEVAA